MAKKKTQQPEITVNTLVTHRKLKTLGIGCVAKVLSCEYIVNFGTDDVMRCKKTILDVVDTSKCKTVQFKEFSLRLINSKSKLDDVIVGNELKHYVGIGWVTTRVVTLEDLQKYPRAVENE